MARRAGIAVEIFSIGFGPKLFTFKWKETEFCVSAIPLGGYVKMHGESEEEQIPKEDQRAFSNKSIQARSGVVLAGPFMNILLSFALMPLVFWIGKPEPAFIHELPVVERILPDSPAEKAGFVIGDRIIALDGKLTPTWESLLEPLIFMGGGKGVSIEIERGGKNETVVVKTETLPRGEGSFIGIEKYFGPAPEASVHDVLPGGPADQAGLKKGDKILSVGGKPVNNWDDLVREINVFQGGEITLEIVREEAKMTLPVEPKKDEESGRWLIGIQAPQPQTLSPLSIRKYGFLEGAKAGFKANWKNLILTFQVIKKLFTAEVSVKTLGGPVAIAYTLAKASASGISDFIYFLSFLSLQLGILNLLPIPVLDGGHLVFFGIEAIRRKPIALKARLIATQVGMVLLLTLVVFVTWNDLRRLIGF